jgi:hypothetical protein
MNYKAGGSARKRQLKKQRQMLLQKLKEANKPNNKPNNNPNNKQGEENLIFLFFGFSPRTETALLDSQLCIKALLRKRFKQLDKIITSIFS